MFFQEGWQYCFDVADGLLMSARYHGDGYVFQDFMAWGAKLFPRRLLSLLKYQTEVEIVIASISTLELSKAQLLTIPEGAKDCPHSSELRVKKKTQPQYPLPVEPMESVYVYATIDATGRVVRPWVFRSAGYRVDKAVLDELPKWQFRPAMCGTTPRETETILMFLGQQ